MIREDEIKYRAEEACNLLKKIIEIPSCTFEEERVADYLFEWLKHKSIKRYGENGIGLEELRNNEYLGAELPKSKDERGASSYEVNYVNREAMFKVIRIANNIVAVPANYNPQWQTLMLNAHIDTVQPAQSYTHNPYQAEEKDGAIYGLGSNDDGGSVVALIQAFLHFMEQGVKSLVKSDIGLNLVLVLSAEEERGGAAGVSRVLEQLPQHGIKIDFAIIGEPTGMRAAIAERGLLVLDGTAEGISGHAARNEGVNALYKAIEDINALRKFKFAKHSAIMGDVKLSVTQINAGVSHNIIPDRCTFVVDIRPTEQYTNSEILELLQKEVSSTLVARNLKNRSSATPQNHLLMKAVHECGIETFVSPTTSDWMRMYYLELPHRLQQDLPCKLQLGSTEGLRRDIPAIKIGPGDSARSHKADEYILKEEISQGIKTYIHLIENITVQIDKI